MPKEQIVFTRAGESRPRLLGHVMEDGSVFASNGDHIPSTIENRRSPLTLAAYLWVVGFDPPYADDPPKVEVLRTFNSRTSTYRLVTYGGQRLLQQRVSDRFGAESWVDCSTGEHTLFLLAGEMERELSKFTYWTNGHARISLCRDTSLKLNSRLVYEARATTNDGWVLWQDPSELDICDVLCSALSPEGADGFVRLAWSEPRD